MTYSVREKIMRELPLTKKEWKYEFSRGYNYGKGFLRNYRSLWVKDGWIWGYTLTGIKHKLFSAGDRYNRSKKEPYLMGFSKALQEGLRAKPKGRLPKKRRR